MSVRILLLTFIAAIVSAGLVKGADTKHAVENEPRSIQDIEYAKRDGISLKLDLYLPSKQTSTTPCVVFVHGGGWKGGDKKSGAKNASWLTGHGFAVASINYRLTDVASWPAQINDCYDAVRWVRDNAAAYHIDGNRVGAWGTSAGAHLAALMGTRPCPDPERTSSRVQAVCDWFGPSDLLTMPPNNVGNGRTLQDVAESNGAKLLDATVREVPELARDASALHHVSSDNAAFLIMHGDQDPGVPIIQSKELHRQLVLAGARSRLKVIEGAGHGGPEFQTAENRADVLRFFQDSLMQNWNQGPGPESTFHVHDAEAPTRWSVTRNQAIRWKKTLPETGQSTVVGWGDRVFFTTMKTVTGDSELGHDIVAWCCNAETGETIWQRPVAAEYPLRLSGCFSDSSGPPPVTDGKHVCFFNASGRISCFDFDGNLLWQNEMMPVGRGQPTVDGDRVVFIKQTYMPDEHGHFTHDHKDAPLELWTQLQALNLATGDLAWNSRCGVNMGCVPLPQTRSDGRRVMVVGRGGGHSPPEKPDGISMIDANDGTTLWTLQIEKFMSTMAFHLRGDDVFVFDAGNHLWVDAMTGKVRRSVSIVDDVNVQMHHQGQWAPETRDIDLGKKTRGIIQQSNVLAGHYHYFRSYTEPWLGRIDVRDGTVEYLQLPVQLRRTATTDDLLWDWKGMEAPVVERLLSASKKRIHSLPITQWAFAPNDMKNSSGHVVMGDKRSMGNGWGHHASQIPTVIGQHLYVPTMAGTVYVIRWGAETLDDKAIVAINDLGEVGKSWTRASLSYGQGRLYAHTIRELICIDD